MIDDQTFFAITIVEDNVWKSLVFVLGDQKLAAQYETQIFVRASSSSILMSSTGKVYRVVHLVAEHCFVDMKLSVTHE